jgi:predicted nuclease of predicted toxin-antitoxin system
LARLYADENFPKPAVDALRRLGHDVLTVAEAGHAGLGIPDEAVLVFAHADGRALLTHNRKHFRNLHRGGWPHSGIILCTEDTDFDSLAARIDQALSQVADVPGQVIRVTRPRA